MHTLMILQASRFLQLRSVPCRSWLLPRGRFTDAAAAQHVTMSGKRTVGEVCPLRPTWR